METEYKTWTLRFVPDSVRGEFINIGLIVGCNSADWAIRTVESFSRANRIGGDAQLLNPLLNTLKAFVSTANCATAGARTGTLAFWDNQGCISEGYLDDLRRRFNNALQISEAYPAYGSSAEEILELLYPHFVSESIRETTHRARTQMRRSFREALNNIWQDDEIPLFTDPTIVSGGERHEFDFALHAPSSVEQMTQVISLNRKDIHAVRRDIRAWNYGVTRLRERGAELELPSHGSLRVPSDVDVAVIHDEPKSDAQYEILSEAQKGWKHMGVLHFSRPRIAEAALQAADSLLTAS